MDIEQVKMRLRSIEALKFNDEDAHIEEDRLYLDLLTSIANGKCDDPRNCAAEAIKSKDISFTRYTG